MYLREYDGTKIMDQLPWHIQMEVFKHLNLDVLRTLNIRPGRLNVPVELTDALNRSLALRMVSGKSLHACFQAVSVNIPIVNTSKYYFIFESKNEHSIYLYDTFAILSKNIVYRSDQCPT